MGFSKILGDIVDFTNEIADTIKEFCEDLLGLATSEKGQQVTSSIVLIISAIVKILELVNPKELSGDEKREAARLITRWVMRCPPDVLQQVANARAHVSDEGLSYPELDVVIGSVIAKHTARAKT
jgi:hypothetical protein